MILPVPALAQPCGRHGEAAAVVGSTRPRRPGTSSTRRTDGGRARAKSAPACRVGEVSEERRQPISGEIAWSALAAEAPTPGAREALAPIDATR